MNVFQASFADFKIVKTRGVAQFVFEVDLRHADAALRVLGGVPQPAAEVPVGIARLIEQPAAAPPEPVPKLSAEIGQLPAEPAKVTRLDARKIGPWDTIGRARQAGIRCREERFWAFLSGWTGESVEDHERAAAVVRNLCEVGSRANLDEDGEAGRRWSRLDARFQTWLRQQETEARYADARR